MSDGGWVICGVGVSGTEAAGKRGACCHVRATVCCQVSQVLHWDDVSLYAAVAVAVSAGQL